jgi:hypothetical protein
MTEINNSQSGKRGGRPKGSRNRRTLLAEKLFAGETEAICRSVIQAAIGGDVRAAQLILDRIAPVPRGRVVTFPLPAFDYSTPAGIDAACAAIVAAVAASQLTVHEAVDLTRMLRDKSETLAISQLRADLDRLIAAQKGLRLVR